jgi:hypothetical protein
MSHEWVGILDALSRFAEAVAVIVAALYARHGARLAKRTARMLGTLQMPWWRRRRPAGPKDETLDRLKADADEALASYLESQRRLTTYTDNPRESRH